MCIDNVIRKQIKLAEARYSMWPYKTNLHIGMIKIFRSCLSCSELLFYVSLCLYTFNGKIIITFRTKQSKIRGCKH